MPHEKPEAVNHIRCWDEWTPANELWQDPFGSFELAIGSVSGLSGECCGHSVVWSSGFCPSAPLCQCIRFQMGQTQALDIPCWGPLKPETLEVDVCLCPVSPRNPVRSKDSKCGLLHEDILDTAWSVGYVPAPDALALYTPPPPPPLC